MIEHIDKVKGEAFNIGGGMKNSLSLIELFDCLEKELDIKLTYTKLSWRSSDQKVFVANINKVKELIGWEPDIGKERGIRMMLDWLNGGFV